MARHLFHKIDLDNDNLISLSELIATAADVTSEEGILLHDLLHLPRVLNQGEGALNAIEKLFQDMDQNYRNGVNYEEFYAYITSHLFLASLETQRNALLMRGE